MYAAIYDPLTSTDLSSTDYVHLNKVYKFSTETGISHCWELKYELEAVQTRRYNCNVGKDTRI